MADKDSKSVDQPTKEKKKFKLGCVGTIIVVIIALIIGIVIGASTTSNTVVTTTTANVSTPTTSTSTATTKTTVTEPITLTSGNYTAGKDFPAGTYTVEVETGTGNVSSSNMYDGGLNEVMSSTGEQDTVKSYKNAKFPSGTTLTVSGVTIKLIPTN